MQGVGASDRRRLDREGPSLLEAAQVSRHFDVVGAGRREGVAEAGVRGGAAVGGVVVVLGQPVVAAVEDPQDAVEAGVVDVEHHCLAGRDGHGVVFEAAMGGSHDGGVRDGVGVGHVIARPEIEAPGQRHGVGDRIVRRPHPLDDVRRAAAFARSAGIDLVSAAAAVERVDAAAAVQDVGVGVAGDGVGVGRAAHLLDSRQGVGAASAAGHARGQVQRDSRTGVSVVSDVMPGAAVQRIVATAADQDVVAVAAVEDVVARPAVQRIRAGLAIDRVVAAEAADGVGEGRPVDGFVGGVPADQQAARRSGGHGLVRELEEFHIADGDRLPQPGDGADLAVPADGVAGPRAGEDHGVRAETAVDLVVAAVAGDEVGGRIAANGVGAGPADHVLDHHAEGDGDVPD